VRVPLTHLVLFDIIMANSWSFLYDELYSNKKMVEHSKYYYDYDRNDPNRKAPDGIVGSGGTDFISSNITLADGYSVRDATEKDFNDFWYDSNSTEYEMDYTKLEGYDLQIDVPDLPETPDNNNGRWKYCEDIILKDVHEYVSGTYRSHYTGKANGFTDIQTIDLLAAKGLASGFCQSNIIKYGTRYGDKDGNNKKDLLKVIHYAMLLLHFDNHYKPTNSDFPY
jgi:hypothetical protein